MRGKATLLIGAAAGYVLGARAGRERYEQIMSTARRYWEDPRVQQKVGELEEKATETAKTKGHDLQDKVSGAARDLKTTAQEKASRSSQEQSAPPPVDLPAYETARTEVPGTTMPTGRGTTTPSGSGTTMPTGSGTTMPTGNDGRLA